MPELIDIRQAFEAGGSVEGNKGSEGTKNVQVYTDTSGKQKLFSSPESAPRPEYSLSFNKDTGKVKISAPQYMLDNSDWIKTNFTNNNNFKSLVNSLRADPEGKTSIKYTNDDGTEEKTTIMGMFEKYQKAFDEYATQYSDIQHIRDYVKNNTANGITMTDKDVLIYSDSRSRQNDQYDDKKVVWLPNIAFSYFDFTKLPSYNADTQTISAKDFYEWYQLDDAEGKDELVLGLTKATEQMIANYTTFSGESETPEAAATDYARTISFYNTLMNDNPSANAFTTIRLGLAGFANAFAANLTKAAADTYIAVSDFADWLDSVDDDIGILKLATTPVKLGANVYRGAADTFYSVGSEMAGIENVVSEETRQELSEINALGLIWDSIADGDFSGILDVIEKSSGIADRVKQSGAGNPLQMARNTIAELDQQAYSDLTRLASSATLGATIGGFAAEIFKQVLVTNPLGQSAGASLLAMSGNAETYRSGLLLMERLMSAKQLSGAVKAGALGMNVVAQGLSDTILNDELALKRMFLEGDAGDAVKAIELNMLFNGIGELSGLATSTGWSAFKQTQLGDAIQAGEQRFVAGLQAKKQKALTTLAEWLNSKKSKTVQGAEYMTAFSKAEIEASENIAAASKKVLAEDTTANTAAREAQEAAVQAKVDLEVAFTRVNTQTGRTVLEMQADPRVAKYWLSTQEAAGAVVKAETGIGIKPGQATKFSQETTDYIVRQNRVEYYLAKSGGDLDKLPANEAAYAKGLQAKVNEFAEKASEELKSAISDYVKRLKQYEHKYMNMLLDEGLVDEDWLKGLRGTGFFGANGQNYMVTQVIKDGDALASAKSLTDELSSGRGYKAKIVADQYSYKPGDIDAHYLDPQLAVLSQQTAFAKVRDSREFGDALRRTQPGFKEIDTNGKPVSSTELNKIRREVRNSASNTLKEFRVQDDILSYEFANTYRSIEDIPGKIAKKEKKIADLLSLDDTRMTSIALDLDAEGITTISKSFDIPEYGPIRTRAELNELYYGGSAAQKQAIDQCLGIDNLTVTNYNKALSETDLSERLARTYIAENESIMGSDIFKKYAEEIRTKELTARQQLILKKNYDTIADLQKQAKLVETGSDEFTATITKFTDDVTRNMRESLSENNFFNELIKKYTDAGINKKAATDYLVLDQLKKTLAKDNSSLNKALNKNLNNLSVSGNLTTRQKTRWAKAIKDSIKDNVDSEWAKSVKVLQKNGANELVDTEAVYEEIYKLMDDFIDTQVKSDTVIQVLDYDGKYHLYEVSPHVAFIYKNRVDFSNIKNSGLVKFFTRTNRLFRLATTGWGLSSFENQWLRDPLNAYVMGGMTRTVGKNTEQLGRLLGPNVVEQMQRQLGDEGWMNLTEGATTETEAIASSVRKQGELLYGDTAMETQYYRSLVQGRRTTLFGDYEEEVGRLEKAIRFLEDKSPGDFREKYLRRAVYSQSFNDSVSMGKTVKEAKNIAEYVADNATTDFSRAFAWGTSITSSVPYLGAAINGNKSFWRLLEIDPLGVSGRFMTGLVIPMMALTANSMNSDVNMQTYKNIPEYVKNDNLVFVTNGQSYKIPIPQELSPFLTFARHIVEKSNDANDNAWGELLLNDMLNLVPIDLTNLANLDDPMGVDADFASRISSVGEGLISQLSPSIVKSAYMLITHRDPYTQQSIDVENTYIDSDGMLQVMDSHDSGLASWFSSMCRGIYDATGWEMFNISPSVADAVLKNFMGQATIDLGNSLENLFSGDLVGIAGIVSKQAGKPFTATSYDMKEKAWRDFVRERESDKEILLQRGDLQRINDRIKNTTDEKTLENLKTQYRQIVQEYQDKVFDGVQRFNQLYGADYDWEKFASTINLLNFGGSAQDLTSESAKDTYRELSSAAKTSALQTMVNMGFNSTNDMSIFGYVRRYQDGTTEWTATSPTAILDMGGAFYRAQDESVARISRTVETFVDANGKSLKDKFNEMKEKETKLIQAKDWKGRNKLYKEWDIEFMTAIYPILAENDMKDAYGKSLLDQKAFKDLIDDYIRVPDDFMGRGKYLSSKSGIDKTRAYAPAYVKYLYDKIGGR